MGQGLDKTAYELFATFEREEEERELGKAVERAKDRIKRGDITADYVLLLAREVERQRRLNGELHKRMMQVKLEMEGGPYGD